MCKRTAPDLFVTWYNGPTFCLSSNSPLFQLIIITILIIIIIIVIMTVTITIIIIIIIMTKILNPATAG